MKSIDALALPHGAVLTSELCIVGSGPAGATIAMELAGLGLDVLVLESGGGEGEEPFAAELNRIESVGATREMDQAKVRNRILGGTSHTWSGRCTTLDAVDFAKRAWLPYSGWPIRPQDLAPALGRAAHYLGLTPLDYDDDLHATLGVSRALNPEQPGELRSVFWQFSRQPGGRDFVRFGPRLQELTADNLRLVTHATVTHIVTDAGGSHVQELEIKTADGAMHRVRSRLFVLCGGGIENARMLLASNRVDPQGVGNKRDLVGRFLMDHPRGVLGTFAPEAAPHIDPHLFLLRHPSGARMQRGLSLSPEAQQREELLNCAAWVTQHVADNDVWTLLRTARAGGETPFALGKIALKHADHVLAGAWHKLVHRRPLPRRFHSLEVDVLLEQAPDPNSRVTLSNRSDALGVPLSRIDWKIGDKERRTAIHLGHAINEALHRAHLPVMRLVDWVRHRQPQNAVFRDPAHPIGATRMAEREELGVVDRDGKVFGIDNLYIAGSSVFPTSGHANPTLMIVALAVRLADTLRQRVA